MKQVKCEACVDMGLELIILLFQETIAVCTLDEVSDEVNDEVNEIGGVRRSKFTDVRTTIFDVNEKYSIAIPGMTSSFVFTASFTSSVPI